MGMTVNEPFFKVGPNTGRTAEKANDINITIKQISFVNISIIIHWNDLPTQRMDISNNKHSYCSTFSSYFYVVQRENGKAREGY